MCTFVCVVAMHILFVMDGVALFRLKRTDTETETETVRQLGVVEGGCFVFDKH